MKDISLNTLAGFEARFDQQANSRLAMNAVTKAGINSVSASYDLQRRMRYGFSLELETGKLTNQKSSGRCWMFASLNTMRVKVMEKLNLETFELSQNYPLFWDKLEKANYFLESIQIHVHSVSHAIQPSHPLLLLSPPALNLSQHQGLFQ